jgi:PAS domain S-box-containing protein
VPSVNATPTIRVLLVDDDALLLHVSKQILSEEGPFEIETTLSADQALEILEKSSIDVVVSDYDMPFKTGLDLLKTLKEKNCKIPFILFTGKGREEIAVKALNLGADRYLNKQGDPQTVYAELSLCIRQLHERAQAQRMLWESEERFEKMVTNSKDLVMLTQTDGIILYMSPSCKNILGYEPNELEGKMPWIIHPEDLEFVQKIFFKALTNQSSGTVEYRIVTKQGETKWVNHSFAQIVENGKIKQIVSTVKDITETKIAQKRLEASEQRFRLAVKNIPIMMAMLNDKLEYTWVYNPNADMPEAAILGKSFGEVMDIEDSEALRKTMFDLIKKGGFLQKEIIVKHKNAAKILDCYFEANVNEKGENTGIRFAAYNITERKQMENELKLSEERWNFALEGAGDGVWDLNTQTNEIFFSNQWLIMLGYEEQETPKNFDDWIKLIHPDDKVNVKAQIDRHLNGSEPICINQYRLLCKDGTYKWILNRCKVVSWTTDGKPLRVIAINTDVTANKKAEDQLRESEEKFSAAFNSNGVALAITRLNDGLFVEANDRLLEVFGFTRKEVIGKTAMELGIYVNPQNRQETVDLALKNQPVINREIKFLKKEGKEITVLFSAKTVNIKGQLHLLATIVDISELKQIEQSLHLRQKELENFLAMVPDPVTIIDIDGKIIDWNDAALKSYGYKQKADALERLAADFIAIEDHPKLFKNYEIAFQGKQVRNITLTGKRADGEKFALEGSANPIFDASGKPTALIAITRDISDKIEKEQKIVELLAQAKLLLEKLNVVGGFVRHDVRNKLSVIANNLFLIKKYSNNNQMMLKQLEQINATINNIVRILEFAETYEAAGSKGLSWIGVKKAANDALVLFSDLKGTEVNVANMDFEVLADSALVEIFHNLVDNSLKYGENLAWIKIYAEKEQTGDLILFYEDNGGGINVDIKPRLFQKGAGKQTGLGLYLIQRICDIYGWSIQEIGKPGEGVCFVIKIPANLTRPLSTLTHEQIEKNKFSSKQGRGK